MFRLGFLDKLKNSLVSSIDRTSNESKMFSLSRETRDKVLVPILRWIIPMSVGVKGFGRRSKVAY